MTVLRIVFCILACICAAAAIPIGIFWDWWCLIPIGGAIVFTFVMLMVKNASAPPQQKTTVDFMNTDEENERIRNEHENHETK